ncbi:hypothetical protein [Phaeobacter sp. J2-8]|uniref:hypothetical protein n=1 Tax=Phaeobacter sp. J2-8 TaxID=2931394 RepID=UPI0032AED33F
MTSIQPGGAHLGDFAFDGAFLDRPKPRHFRPANGQFVVLPIIPCGDQHHQSQHKPLTMFIRRKRRHAKSGQNIVFQGRGMTPDRFCRLHGLLRFNAGLSGCHARFFHACQRFSELAVNLRPIRRFCQAIAWIECSADLNSK